MIWWLTILSTVHIPMVNTVEWRNAERIVFWIKRSVSESTLAVASSMHITWNQTIMEIKYRKWIMWNVRHTWELSNRARARQSNCFCPTENSLPRSWTSVDKPIGHLAIVSRKWQRSKDFHSCRSEYWPIGSKFSRTVPLKMNGSWGMMASRDLLRNLMEFKMNGTS